ncbi:tetratricopeptide repeat protein 16 [Notechis scutatus]|uniref:Tetratricopeptide repeat protein 16 n=1 Tax=Notechis scutatus TaxID=8663 RepID=A0A6J1VXQ7_9SAUR|nr:tetratricopeptide repeat protein 16 [Notechis scutatus]
MEDEEEVEEPKAKVKEVKMSTIVMTLFPTAVSEEKLQESKEKAITRIFGPAKTLLKVKNPQRAGDYESILNRKIDEHCREGDLYFSQGEWEEAITRYTKALNLDPNKGELYERKAEAFLQLCDFQSAAMHLRKVYHMSPKEGTRERLAFIVFIQPGRGTLLRRLKDFSAAIDDYLRAVELCRANEASEVRREAEKQVLLSYNDFAVHCYFKGCYEEAVLLLNKAIKGEKNEFGLYINRGDCFLKLGQLNFAMADYQQALELHPLDPRLRHRIAWLSNESGLQDFREKQYLQAETHFSCAVDNDPWEVKYYLNRAKTRVFLQEFLGAKEDMISALLLNPNKEEVRTLMGNLFPGENKESLLNSKVGDLTKTLLDRKLKSFPGGKAEIFPLQRPLKSTGSEPSTNMYIQIEDQKGEEKEEGSEEKKLQKRLAECQQNSHQANEELKEARQNKPALESKTVWVDACARPPPKDCPKEPYCWRKF